MNKFEMPCIELVSFTQFETIATVSDITGGDPVFGTASSGQGYEPY